MLTYHIGDALGFHFLFPPRLLFFRQYLGRVMQLGMGDFVYQGLYRLRLAHTGPQDDSALGWAEISLCSTWNEILHYRNRRTGRETIIHGLKILHIACKLSYSQCWQFPPLGLAHIEYMGYLKACDSGNAGFLSAFRLDYREAVRSVDLLLPAKHTAAQGMGPESECLFRPV